MTQAFSGQLAALHLLCRTALMAALMAAGALFHLSLGPVPFTLQDMFVALAGLVLGPRHGPYAVGLYILAGCAGLPVFSGGRAGLGHLIGPTGGYLAGFMLLAFCSGLGGRLAAAKSGQAAEKSASATTKNGRAAKDSLRALWPALAWTVCGWALMYAAGASWLMWTMNLSSFQGLSLGVLPFLPAAAIKLPLCLLLWRALRRRELLPG
ncbi:biotin transporter BioY [Desulfovibrio sp. OttesenSCG-928-G11]|nr:biotin transporter BioY [Desulfovibrio sp. OttesenSCG-928-G11]